MKFWNEFTAARKCMDALTGRGVSIEVTIDQEKVHRSVRDIGKPYLTPWLDPERNDFNETNYFWLIATKDGSVSMVGGGRLDEVGATAGKSMLKMFRRGYGDEAVLAISGDVDRNLSGRLCYLGDLYSRATKGLGRASVGQFLGLANFIASNQFRADATYSFMRQADVKRGAADVNGFCRRVYDPVSWGVCPVGRDVSEIIVFRNSSDDADYFSNLKRELA